MHGLKKIAGAVALAAAAGAAQAWPDRPVTLVVPFTPGTGIDLVARQLSAKLPAALGQPVVVENVAGASGNIGSERVARAAPDGYTLMVTVSTFVMNRSLFKSLRYDPLTDFAPIALTSWGSQLLVVPAARPYASMADLVAAAKAAPGKLTYATPGVGTPHHLAMALFLDKTRGDMLHVPYKGTSGAVTDLVGGQVDAMFLPVHVALPLIRGGRVKAIAAGSPERLPQLPAVPTLQEAGLAGVDVNMWFGVLGPKGTPPEIVARMNREIASILKSPEVARAFETQGMTPATSTPAEFGTLIERDAARWADVVKRAGIVPE